MKKSRRGIKSVLDLGRVPVTPIKRDEQYETRDEFFAREAREEQERKEAPFRKLENEFNATLQEAQARVKKFFSLPIAELETFPASKAPIDPIGDYVEQVGDRDPDAERAAFVTVFEKLKAAGCELSSDAWLRLGKYAGMLGVQRNIVLTPETLQQALERLADLGCFAANPGEVTGEIPRTTPQSTEHSQPRESKKQLRQRIEQGIEKLPADSREGREACLAIIGRMYSYDVEVIFRSWAEQMERDWNVDVLTPKITKYAGDWFLRWNKNPLDKRNYDELRRVLSKLGYLGPLDYRTKEEKLADIVENAQLDDRDFRRGFAHHTREIIEAGPGRKGGIIFR